MNKIIDYKQIKPQLNKCFEHYDPHWTEEVGTARQRNGFKYYLERTAGVRLDFETEIRHGQAGYKINKAEVIDESLFLMWMLRWS
jgi:hypothetical protein